jgi:4-hydroxy-tetrahydrodipicolinate synthase
MTTFTGCGTALVTPFRKDQSLDEQTLRALVRRQIEAGIDFLVPCGTTGESPTLSHAEHLRVVAIAIEEAKGKVPVLSGAGGYNTAEVIAMAQELRHMGADGLITTSPRRRGSSAITRPSRRPFPCRLWCITFKAAQASMSSLLR